MHGTSESALDSFDPANVENIIKHALINELNCVVPYSNLSLVCIMHRIHVKSKMSREDDFPIKSLAKHFKIHCYRIFIVHVTPERNTRFCLSFRLRLRTSNNFNIIFFPPRRPTILILHSTIIFIRSQQIIYYQLYTLCEPIDLLHLPLVHP